ncbi:MAG: GTPase ObgE [Acidimicrobiia bacterium]
MDECGLNVRGGDGGAGCVSTRREAHVAMGGPDGGDGGKGGDVWLVADHNVASLLAYANHPHRRGTDGKHGTSKTMHGSRGTDLVAKVPVGTTVRDLYTGEILADLTRHGDRWLAAAGGRGGKGNARFLSNRLRAPSFAEQGEPGEERWLKLELRLMADVALVGFPNAGKSTFISRISAAKPKIADYPFTTLEPHLGVVRVDDEFEMVVADIPGLIEGASEGKGLGHQFLRHIERARALCVLVDLAAADGTSPEDQEAVLLHELGAYRPELLERPRVVIGSKSDVAEATFDGLCMSAVTGEGLKPVVSALAKVVAETRNAEPTGEGFVLHRPVADGIRVEKEGDGIFRVIGRSAERAVALSDLTNPEALAYADGRLRKLGVGKALAKAGARDGDEVRVGAFTFSYEPEH